MPHPSLGWGTGEKRTAFFYYSLCECETSLTATVGAYIYIKPPLQTFWIPSVLWCLWRTDKNAGCSSGLSVAPLSPCWQPGWYRWQTSDQTSLKWPCHTQFNHFLCLPPVTSCLRGLQAWLVESCQGDRASLSNDRNRRMRAMVFLGPPFERLAVFRLWRPPPPLFCLPSPLPSALRFRGFCLSASPFSSLHTAAPTQHLSEGQHINGTSICLEPGLDFPHMDGLNALLYSSRVPLKWKQVFLWAKNCAEFG